MKTLFGIRSNLSMVIVASIYLIISLNTSINGINKFKAFLAQDDDEESSESLFLYTNTNFFHIFTLILSISCLVSSILLILGIVEKRYQIIKPWLIVNVALETVLSIGVLYLIYLSYQVFQYNWKNGCGIILAIFCNLIVVVFHDYIRTGVYHLYKKIKIESRRLYRVIDCEDQESIRLV
ncbi:uncharacterized protein ACRADG_011343 [Cochliomyia hominivorax]